MPSQFSIVIIDKDKQSRDSITTTLRPYADTITLAGSVDNFADGAVAIQKTAPNVVILGIDNIEQLVARSLRAGHSFTTAIQLVGQEVPAPVGELFKNAYDQQLLGLRITDGLSNMNDRIESLDLRFFTTVVSINAEIGGNLSEVLDKLALTIRERLRIRRQVQVYTAQGRMSGYVLGALPVVTFVFFSFLHPDYEMVLFRDPMGLYILVLAASLQLFGLMVIRKIIRIQI